MQHREIAKYSLGHPTTVHVAWTVGPARRFQIGNRNEVTETLRSLQDGRTDGAGSGERWLTVLQSLLLLVLGSPPVPTVPTVPAVPTVVWILLCSSGGGQELFLLVGKLPHQL